MSGHTYRFRKPAIALAAIATMTLTGCGDDSERPGKATDEESSKGTEKVDFSSRQSVVDAFGRAYAAGDCEAASELHVPDSYDIDCSDSYDYNPFVTAKNMGLTLKGSEPDNEEGFKDSDGFTIGAGNPEEFILTFTTDNGYMVKSDPVRTELRGDKYLVASPLYVMPTAEDLD